MRNSGTIRLGGKTLRQVLEKTIMTPSYQSMSAESVNGMPSARVDALQTIIQRYRRAAMFKTQREIPELNDAEIASRRLR
jgi:hypothetical protein